MLPLRFGLVSLAALGTCLLLQAGGLLADDPTKTDNPPRKFIRLLKEDDRPVALQTSIVRYARSTRGGSPTVDLIGAVHIGDRAYYERLNEIFQQYDVVLFELVSREEDRVSKSAESGGNPLSAMQRGLKSLLELEFQLDHIDYERPNMVHADLSPDEFFKSMEDRGEGLMQMFFRALGHGAAIQAKDPAASGDVQLLAALLSRDRSRQLKMLVARQFDSVGDSVLFDGPDGSTIVTVRNKRAMDVLERQMRAGKKRIAIFYGAAHMADMQRQLDERFEMKPIQERWVTAWQLEAEPAAHPVSRGPSR